MKLNKKKVFSLALVALLIATISFGTLAWFSDSDETTNTFYVATSEDDSADDIFSVNVYEDVDTDNDGTLEKEDDEGAEFSDILPGQKIVKKPYVENTGRYDQWVRLTITFESQDAWYRVNGGKPIDLLTLDPDFNSNWVGDSYSAENGAYTYVYYSRNPLGAGETLPTFTQVNIPTNLTQQDMFAIKSLDLTVKAEAVQVDNLGVNTAKEAFALVEADQAIG